MKKIALFAFALLFTSALAQTSIAPKAADLLERAKTAHGGAALENLSTYQDTGTYTVYQNGAVAGEFEATQTYDFKTERGRLDIKISGASAQIYGFSPTEAWTWTVAAGVVKVPAAQAKLFRDGLYQSLFGLRNGGKNRETASADGVVDLGNGVKGESVTVVTKGAQSKYVFDDTGTWIGGKDTVEGQEIVNSQADYRVVDGIKVPFSSKTSIGGQPYIDTKLSSVKINPVLTDADFAKPQK
jgi:hypothetical protein